MNEDKGGGREASFMSYNNKKLTIVTKFKLDYITALN